MITTLAGPNTFLIQAELKRQVNEFVEQYGDLALEKIDGEEAPYERVTESLQSLPFLASKKLVVLRNPSAQKQFTEKFEELLQAIPDTTDVVLVETKPDKRTAFYKALQKHTEFHEYKELDAGELPKWLADEAKTRGGNLSFADATYLMQRVGANQQLLHNELEKLLLYQPEITRQTVDILTEPAPQSTIFELLDAAFAGNSKRAMEMYKEQRALKVEPQQIMAMIAWQLHVLAIIKTAGNRTLEEIAIDAKLNPYVVRKSAGIAHKLTMQQVKKLIADALELDVRLKTESIDADDALQHFLLTVTR